MERGVMLNFTLELFNSAFPQVLMKRIVVLTFLFPAEKWLYALVSNLKDIRDKNTFFDHLITILNDPY